MRTLERLTKSDLPIYFGIAFLFVFSFLILNSIAPNLFPQYYVYIFLGVLVFIIFSKIEFEILSLFSLHIYVLSVVFLILPLLIGQVTRGAVRWVSVGSSTIQPAELVKPFLLVLLANYITKKDLNFKRLLKSVVLFAFPFFLILIQPSLGMAILFLMGFLGILLASALPKKYFVYAGLALLIIIPLSFNFLAPYQKQRVMTFLNPSQDPFGSGYHSIQSMISVGSGKLFGSGLGKGIQTQLAFLPEKHNDFIFAAISEETGMLGAILVILGEFFILYRLTTFIDNSSDRAYRAYIAGLFLTMFAQTVIHIGMNVGMLPVTGLGFPLVSAGGSSLVGTMIGLGIALSYKKKGLNLG